MSMNGDSIPGNLSTRFSNAALVGALMVAFIHVWFSGPVGSLSWWGHELIAEGVCRGAVPFFFVISGFFLAGHIDEGGWYGREVRKRIRSVLVPYLLWNALFAVYCAGIQVLTAVGKEDPIDTALIIDPVRVFGLNFAHVPICYPLWYMRSLFLLVLLSPLLVMIARNVLSLAVAFAVCLAAHLFLSHNAYWTWLDYLFSPIAGFYFLLGLRLRKEMWILDRVIALSRETACLCAGGAFLGIVLMACCKREGLQMCHEILFAGVVPLLCVLMVRLVPAKRIALAVAAFPIFVLHQFSIQALEFVLSVLGVGNPLRVSLVGYLVRGVLVVFFAIVAYVVLKRVAGRCLAFLFGGRMEGRH